jgi:hypothetical protein
VCASCRSLSLPSRASAHCASPAPYFPDPSLLPPAASLPSVRPSVHPSLTHSLTDSLLVRTQLAHHADHARQLAHRSVHCAAAGCGDGDASPPYHADGACTCAVLGSRLIPAMLLPCRTRSVHPLLCSTFLGAPHVMQSRRLARQPCATLGGCLRLFSVESVGGVVVGRMD